MLYDQTFITGSYNINVSLVGIDDYCILLLKLMCWLEVLCFILINTM